MTKIPLSDDELDGVSGGAFRGNDPFSRAMRQIENQIEFVARAQQEAIKAAHVQQANATAKHAPAEQPESAKHGTAEQQQNQPQAYAAKGAPAGEPTEKWLAGALSKAQADLTPGAANIFLAKMGTYDAKTSSAEELQKAIAVNREDAIKFDKIVSSSSLSSSSTMDFLARAMIEQASQQRKTAMNERLEARENAKEELIKQAENIKDSSALMKANAMNSVIAATVAGAISGLGSVNSSGGNIKAAAMDDQAKAAKGGNIVHDGLSKDLSGVDALAKAKAKGAEPDIKASQTDQLSKVGSPTADAYNELDKQIAATKSSIEGANVSMVKEITSFIRDLQEAKAEQMKALTKL